jgi:uncharacterized membrane protein YdjX (TVP38/TMEM64 family)
MTGRTSRAVAKGLVLLLALVAAGWLVSAHGVPTAAEVRGLVVGADAWAPALYVLVFAVLTLVAAPRNVLTTVGAALFGMAGGIALSWLAALLGAVAGFAVGRWLGADAVERLTRGRLDRVSTALRDHGLESVVAARLMPVVPFTAVNYGAGVLGVRLAHFALGTAVGIVPGTIAYAVLGAYALDDPWALAAVGAGLLVLFVAGTLVGRRLRARRQPERRCPAPESADAAL